MAKKQRKRRLLNFKPSADDRVFDVSEPANAKPQPTSRPIIVGHRPTMIDPMIAARPLQHQPRPPLSPSPSPPSAPSPKAEPPGQIISKLSPPKVDNFAYKSAETPTSTAREKIEDKPKGPPALIEGEPLQSPPFGSPINESSPPHRPGEKARLGPLIPDSAGRAPQAKESVEDNQPLEMPAAKHRNHVWRWLISLIVLTIIGLYILIDANLLDVNIDLPFEIFKDAPPVYTSGVN